MECIELERRKSLLEPETKIFSKRKQCELLGIARSGLYYRPRDPATEDLELMKAIDQQYLKTPFYGRRRMTVEMRKQDLSKSHREHKKYPYLMKNMKVERADQAWAADITYLPLHRGFGYLFAIID